MKIEKRGINMGSISTAAQAGELLIAVACILLIFFQHGHLCPVFRLTIQLNSGKNCILLQRCDSLGATISAGGLAVLQTAQKIKRVQCT